ncbi:MAG: VTT domain-containing protein [Actinomycetota bacterium]|nr:VTT domain-containing protein [Actinomycetota bacterium]
MLSLVRHSFAVVLLAVMVEELGIPMPIPTDVLIVLVGTSVGRSAWQLGLLFVVLAVASAVGATGLYSLVRYGGRPLIDRFGQYVHLGPKQIARSEMLLARGGWGGIALGRSIPGLRYATVVACGLFKVSYPRFITAHFVGSSIYIVVFLVLGAVFGPTVLDWIHLPGLGIHMLWLLLLTVALPLLMIWWGLRAHPRQPANPSRRRRVGAVLLGGFVGASALAGTWSLVDTVTRLMGVSYPFLTQWGAGAHGYSDSLLGYAALLSLSIGIAVAYYELVLPYLTLHSLSLPRQTLGLALLAFSLFGMIFGSTLLGFVREGSFSFWWQSGSLVVLLGDALGVVSYALTTVYGRALAIAVVPTLRRSA